MEEVKNIEKAVEKDLYEVGFHILPSVADVDVESKYNDIKGFITKHCGKIVSEEVPKLINLSYTMVKVIDNKHERFDTAYFGWVTFEMEPKDLIALKEELDQYSDILRFLIVKTSEDADSKTVSILKEERSPEKTIEAPHEVEESAPVLEKELDEKLDQMEI